MSVHRAVRAAARRLAFTIASAGVAIGTGSAQSPSPAIPRRLGATEWSSIRAAHDASERAAVAVDGGWRAVDPRQQWSEQFDGHGFRVIPSGAQWSFGLALESYGIAGAEHAVSRPRATSAEGRRVAYAWDATLEEWYVNDARGLEHGFTVSERPAGQNGSLVLTLAVRGDLQPVAATDGSAIAFTASGIAAVNYSGLVVRDASGRELTARLEVVGDRIRFVIDEAGARYPLSIDPIAQQAYLKASNAEYADEFGSAVAVSGDTIVVGAPGEDSLASGVNGDQSDNSAGDVGAAYVFVRSGTTWTQQAYLKASNPDANDRFGGAVAIAGDTIVIGASGESSGSTGVNGTESDNSKVDAGAAYVFVRSGTSWSQQAYLKGSTAAAFDQFGCSVAISGDTVVVGAIIAQKATVFVRSGTTWTTETDLVASNAGTRDQFGCAVAVDGDTVVVGADWEESNATGVGGDQSDNSLQEAGAAYVFVRSGTTWSQQAYLKASNTETFDDFGYAVAVAGDTAVVSALGEGSNATGVNGDQSDNSMGNAGAVYVFLRSGTTWSQQAYLKASNTDAGDWFGHSLSIEGDTLLVGAPGEFSNATGVNGGQSDNSLRFAGAVYVFARNGTVWSQLAYVKASNTDAFDDFGFSVSLSGDTFVAGAAGEYSSATGVNGDQSDNSAPGAGAAYVFLRTPGPPPLGPATVLPMYFTNGQTVPVTASSATGNATCYLDPVTKVLTCEADVTGLQGAVYSAHLHRGIPGVNGATLATLSGGPTHLSGAVGLSSAQIDEVRAGGLYVDVHTSAYPAGEVRAQVVPALSRFIAVLNGAKETPANGSAAVATGTLVVNPGNTVTYAITFAGLTANVTVAHLHEGVAGVAGPIVAGMTLTTPVGTSGTFSGTTSALTDVQIAKLRAGRMYVDVHSAAYGGGEIRGQVAASFAEYGVGCHGSAALGGGGVTTPGGILVLDVHGGTPFAYPSLLFMGAAGDQRAFPYGCRFAMAFAPTWTISLPPLDAAGALALPIALPALPLLASPLCLPLQYFAGDPAQLGGFFATNGLQLCIDA